NKQSQADSNSSGKSVCRPLLFQLLLQQRAKVSVYCFYNWIQQIGDGKSVNNRLQNSNDRPDHAEDRVYPEKRKIKNDTCRDYKEKCQTSPKGLANSGRAFSSKSRQFIRLFFLFVSDSRMTGIFSLQILPSRLKHI